MLAEPKLNTIKTTTSSPADGVRNSNEVSCSSVLKTKANATVCMDRDVGRPPAVDTASSEPGMQADFQTTTRSSNKNPRYGNSSSMLSSEALRCSVALLDELRQRVSDVEQAKARSATRRADCIRTSFVRATAISPYAAKQQQVAIATARASGTPPPSWMDKAKAVEIFRRGRGLSCNDTSCEAALLLPVDIRGGWASWQFTIAGDATDGLWFGAGRFSHTDSIDKLMATSSKKSFGRHNDNSAATDLQVQRKVNFLSCARKMVGIRTWKVKERAGDCGLEKSVTIERIMPETECALSSTLLEGNPITLC